MAHDPTITLSQRNGYPLYKKSNPSRACARLITVRIPIHKGCLFVFPKILQSYALSSTKFGLIN